MIQKRKYNTIEWMQIRIFFASVSTFELVSVLQSYNHPGLSYEIVMTFTCILKLHENLGATDNLCFVNGLFGSLGRDPITGFV